MRLKWYGTATILLEQDKTRLLFDPFIPLSDSTLFPPMNEFSEIEHILVTHGHPDHISSIPTIIGHCAKDAVVYCTGKPRECLIAKGVSKGRIQEINPGDVFRTGSVEVRVLKGKHIIFDTKLLIKTFLSRRILKYWSNFRYLLRENKRCIEGGETVIYEVFSEKKRIVIMGSLNLDKDTEYQKGADLLVLPLQGRSDICNYSMFVIDCLQPKKVMLDHFDDAFPPISSAVDTEPFISLMREKHPGVEVIRPIADTAWIEV